MARRRAITRLTRAVGRARTVARPPIPPAGWEAYRDCACAYCAHVRGATGPRDPHDVRNLFGCAPGVYRLRRREVTR